MHISDAHKHHIFIIGSKGIPAAYGGYETFVDKLTEYHQKRTDLTYHIACKGNESKEFIYHNAHCFQISIPDIGAAQAILYDIQALKYCCDYIKKNHIENPIIYVLACRIGPFIGYYKKIIRRQGGKLYVNPDGHEWLRAKWSAPIRMYWKYSERLMVKHADLLVCDSKNIEKYIQNTYHSFCPHTTYIAYGAETRKSILNDDSSELLEWYRKYGIKRNDYYLVVGRFVPENNYLTMIREFMDSNSKKDFVLVTNVTDKFLEELRRETHFDQDRRIKFVGTVYDQELLMKIRENAYGYLHGHEVGGTNPSLLEALGSTRLNLLLDVGFNREVAEDGALYWTKEKGNLSKLIEYAEKLSDGEIEVLEGHAKARIEKWYSWGHISSEYLRLFLKG